MSPKTKVMTRKQKKGEKKTTEELSEELTVLRGEILEKLTASTKKDEELLVKYTEEVLKSEVSFMKAAELKLKTGRTETRKKSKTRKEEKISRLVQAGERGVLTVMELAHYSREYKKTAMELSESLKSRGYIGKVQMLCVQQENLQVECVKLQGRIEEGQELVRKAMLGEGACRNPECQEASLHRCSGCLLVSYCSLQCSHLYWKEHRLVCNREQAARKIRKEERKEKRNQKAERKAEKAADEEASKVIQEVD